MKQTVHFAMNATEPATPSANGMPIWFIVMIVIGAVITLYTLLHVFGAIDYWRCLKYRDSLQNDSNIIDEHDIFKP